MSYYRRNYRKKSYGNRSYGNKGGTCRTCGQWQKNLAAHLRAYPDHKKRTYNSGRRRYTRRSYNRY